jgi:malate synthase
VTPIETSTGMPAGVRLRARAQGPQLAILSAEALGFLARLSRAFAARRAQLLAARRARRARRDAGERPDFLAETAGVRAADWRVAAPPPDLLERTVEITGPVERKMIINALNSGANVFMADFEDSSSPTFENVLDGQVNLFDAVRRTITWQAPEGGKRYELAERTATLVVRPRGWHLEEAHLEIDGAPISAALFDFGLFFFHNARELVARGSGPYVYLPKLESHFEARLWNDVFLAAQEELGLPRGSVRATVLIETLPAAFEMDEILFELREHSSGLNCGRWDYIFSFIKEFRADPAFVLPERARVGMGEHFLKSYSELLVRTCHRRGAHAMGGMAAQIPDRHDVARNEAALAKVRADKRREAAAGHDGTWVAHPGLVALAREEFERVLDGPHQMHVARADVHVTADDLLRVPAGPISEAGVRTNIAVGIRYLAAWLSGNGCVPIDGLMEDAATAEISRAQLWQWRTHGARLDDGRILDAALLQRLIDEEMETLHTAVGREAWQAGRYDTARELFGELVLARELADFLTLTAYRTLVAPRP